MSPGITGSRALWLGAGRGGLGPSEQLRAATAGKRCQMLSASISTSVVVRTLSGYHQSLRSKTTGSRPQEIAGAIGERQLRSTKTPSPTASRMDTYPYGKLRAIKVPTMATSEGISTSCSGARAHAPPGWVNTPYASEPISGSIKYAMP